MPDPSTVRLIARDVKARSERLLARMSMSGDWSDMQAVTRELVALVKALAVAVEELDSPPKQSPTPLRPVT